MRTIIVKKVTDESLITQYRIQIQKDGHENTYQTLTVNILSIFYCISNYTYYYCDPLTSFDYPESNKAFYLCPEIANLSIKSTINKLIYNSRITNQLNRKAILFNDTSKQVQIYTCDFDVMGEYFYDVYDDRYPSQKYTWLISLIGYPNC